jgi:hypothetical protein
MIYTLTESSVTVLGDDFVPKTMPSTHPAFDQVVSALKADNDNEVKKLMDLPNAIASFMQGKIQITERQLFYDGKPITNSLTMRVLQFMQEGKPELAQPLIHFLEKVRQNPSRRATEGLYDWAVRSTLPITPEGDIIAWKIVREDYRDYHSGNFDNSIGQIVSVERNEVDEDPDRTCSHGLHFCSTAYLPHYYAGDSDRRILVVKINPADVVAFPRDYNVAKGRACRYEVIGEVPEEKAKDFFPSVVTNYGSHIDDINTDPDGELAEELEVDRYYRARNGKMFYVQAFVDDGDEYPYVADDVETGESYSFGRYGSYNVYEEHDLDLVELLHGDFDPNAVETDTSERPRSFFSAFFDALLNPTR